MITVTQAQKEEFLKKIIPLAQKDMQKTGILASLTIAQAIVESGWGLSGLTVKANALFGIKATKSWKGKIYSCKTKECYDGKNLVEITDAFRAYNSWEESVADHSALFLSLPRYANLINCTDYKTACRNVQADGYATAPNYAQTLISVIETYKLYQYDNLSAPAPAQGTSTTSNVQAAIVSTKRITISQGQWNVRAEPNLNGKIIKIVSTGQTYTSSKTVNGWYYIDDLKGYISPKAISKVENIEVKSTSKTYTVQKGDSWWGIAQKQLGNGNRCQELASYNGVTINTVIHPGQTLKIPG